MRHKWKNKFGKSVNLIAHSSPRSLISEQYRLIRTNIQLSSGNQNIKSIVVTSPLPSDGKTTIAANLAIVLAQQGKPVVLIDSDLRKPTMHYAFNVNNIDGLTSVLTNNIGLDEVILRTHIPNLDIITSGPISQNPSELLDSKSMEDVIEKLKKQYEYVVFDTPPVLAVTDAQILAHKSDGTVMVIACGRTSQNGAAKARKLLDKAKTPLLGVVLNEVKGKNIKNYYL